MSRWEGLLREAMVPATGWRKGLVRLEGVSTHFVEGLLDGEGGAWEIEADAPPVLNAQNAKRLGERVEVLRSMGYHIRAVQLEGKWYVASRYADNLKPWTGIVLTGDWADGSCGDTPEQHSAPATFNGHKVMLYVRWRHADPWRGHVVRLVEGLNPELLFQHPWSPNLLPTNRRSTFLGMNLGPRGIKKDDERGAKQRLVEQATGWLETHWDDQAAWVSDRDVD